MKSVEVYSTGIVTCSVCAIKDMPPEQVEEEVNQRNPTGISSRWAIAKEKAFSSGEPNPYPCNRKPSERLHYLMHC